MPNCASWVRPIAQEAPNEEETVQVMRNADRLARRMTGTHASSLGLHSAVYFYSANGRHQPTAVLAMAAFLMQLEADNRFFEFTSARATFEQFLLDHKMYVNQLTTKYGSMAKGYRQLKDYFWHVLNLFVSGNSVDQVSAELLAHDRYHALVKERPMKTKKAKAFSQDVKQWAFLSKALEKSFECHLCKARIDTKAMQLDHVVDKKSGGIGSGDNALWAHPYCNSTFKDHT
jgi:5-methylcytosine-specific restriction endonuclease McrA